MLSIEGERRESAQRGIKGGSWELKKLLGGFGESVAQKEFSVLEEFLRAFG